MMLTAADSDFGAELAGFNTAYTLTPDVVVAATDSTDVVAAIEYARDNGMPVSVFATGHGTHAPIDSGLVINVSRLDSVVIDPQERTATVGGGTRWAAVIEAAAPFGLAPITGSSPNVGVVGYITGGGLGPLARSHGFSSDWVRSVTLATASGDILTLSAVENADLFWALRGGKEGFGVVLDVTIGLVELATLYGGALVFEEEHIDTVLRGWAAYTLDAPDAVTTSVLIVSFPPLEFIPEPFRGKRLLMLRFAYAGNSVTGEALAAPLRALAPIYLDELRELANHEVGLIHNDPVDPGPGWGFGGLLTAVTDGFADVVLGFVGPGSRSPFLGLEVRHIGGATRRDVPEGSAVGGRNSEYAFHVLGAPDPSLFAEVLPAVAVEFLSAIDPWMSPETTVNFANAATLDRAWPRETADRLASIRSRVDPTGMFPFQP